jgi:transposase
MDVHRDVNAARNVLVWGLSLSSAKCATCEWLRISGGSF